MNTANAAVLLLDLQEQIVVNSRTRNLADLERGSVVLARLAMLHDLPVFLSAVPPGGAFLGGILSALGQPQVRTRTFTSAFEDTMLVRDLAATGRKIVAIAGVASEIVVQRTALDAIEAGYTVHVLVDACGGLSPRTEQAAWMRIVAAGGATSSVVTFAAEIAGDFTSQLGGQTLGLMYEALDR